MSNNRFTNIDFKNFSPLYGQIMTIPSNTLLYRSYDNKYPIISERPAFFGSLDNARHYKQLNGRETRVFINTRDLYLIDIRYMKDLINQIFSNSFNKSKELTEAILTCTLSLGMCSYEKQLDLFKIRYSQELVDKDNDTIERYNHMKSILDKYNSTNIDKRNPILGLSELKGIRIGETNNDIEMTYIAKTLLENICDGFIAPALWSPYHYDYNNIEPEEILLFNPKKCNLKVTQLESLKNYKIDNLVIEDYLLNRFKSHYIVNYGSKIFLSRDLLRGGTQNYIDKNIYINSMSKKEHKALDRWSKKATEGLFKPKDIYLESLRNNI